MKTEKKKRKSEKEKKMNEEKYFKRSACRLPNKFKMNPSLAILFAPDLWVAPVEKFSMLGFSSCKNRKKCTCVRFSHLGRPDSCGIFILNVP